MSGSDTLKIFAPYAFTKRDIKSGCETIQNHHDTIHITIKSLYYNMCHDMILLQILKNSFKILQIEIILWNDLLPLKIRCLSSGFTRTL